MNQKRILSLALAAAMALSLTACFLFTFLRISRYFYINR